jgi:hypothetical protein
MVCRDKKAAAASASIRPATQAPAPTRAGNQSNSPFYNEVIERNASSFGNALSANNTRRVRS